MIEILINDMNDSESSIKRWFDKSSSASAGRSTFFHVTFIPL